MKHVLALVFVLCSCAELPLTQPDAAGSTAPQDDAAAPPADDVSLGNSQGDGYVQDASVAPHDAGVFTDVHDAGVTVVDTGAPDPPDAQPDVKAPPPSCGDVGQAACGDWCQPGGTPLPVGNLNSGEYVCMACGAPGAPCCFAQGADQLNPRMGTCTSTVCSRPDADGYPTC